MTKMNLKRIAPFILTAFALCLLPLGTHAATSDSPALAAASRWIESAEFKHLAANPDQLFVNAATEDHHTAKSVAALRTWAVANLPPTVRDYRVTDAAQLASLAEKLRPLFLRFPVAAHLEIFLFESESPYLALAEKTMIVISTSAARDFTPSELRAVAAHELGHLFNYDALEAAVAARDALNLCLYEFQADALGTMLSVLAGEQPDTLYNAIRRLCEFQEKCHLIDQALINFYPTRAERKILCERVAQLLYPAAAPVKR
jgi:hypothetical protein